MKALGYCYMIGHSYALVDVKRGCFLYQDFGEPDSSQVFINRTISYIGHT